MVLYKVYQRFMDIGMEDTIERKQQTWDRILVTGKSNVVVSDGAALHHSYYLFFLWRLDSFVLFGCCTNGHAIVETVNYIEHYGLVRKRNESGYYRHDACTFLELKSFIGQGGFIGTNRDIQIIITRQQKIPDFAAL